MMKNPDAESLRSDGTPGKSGGSEMASSDDLGPLQARPPMIMLDMPPSRRVALLNIDMQNAFMSGTWMAPVDASTILGRVNRLAHACRKAGILVIHTAVVFRPGGVNAGYQRGPRSPDSSYHSIARSFSRGSPLVALHRDLAVEKRDIVLEKARNGAFYATDLELILRSQGIDTLIVSGIASNVCCETTIREAAVRDFNIFFARDASGTVPMGDLTAEQIHEATCTTLGQQYACVLTTEEIITKIESTTDKRT